MSAKIRAILLDFDGTLIDSEPLHYEAWSAAVAPYGAGVDWDDYRRRFVGQTDRWAGEIFLNEAGHEATPERVDEVRLAKHAYFRERAPERLRVSEETRRFLLEGLNGHTVAVVSSSPLIDVEPVLERSGVRRRIELIVSGDDVVKHKPDPEPYEKALAALILKGLVSSRNECVVFEDSSSGLRSAEAAGLRVVRVEDPADLPSLINTALSVK